MKVVRLDLAGLEAPDMTAPDGVTLSSLETHPELVQGVYEVALEALPDIPGDGPDCARSPSRSSGCGTSIARTSRLGAFAIALDDATRPGRRLREPHARARPGARSPGTA